MGPQGPGGIYKGAYDASGLSQDQRQWLFQQFGHSGQAPAGYGGEHVSGDQGKNFTVGQTPTLNFAPSTQDIINSANQIRQATIQANQPAIQTLTAGSQSLADRYQNVLNSITAGSQTQVNQAQQAGGAELARRGISPGGLLYNQTLNQYMQPVQSAEQGLYAQTSQTQGQDLLNLASQIAQLSQGGNYMDAVSAAQQLGQMQQAGAQYGATLPSTIALAQAQAQEAQTAANYIPTAQGASIYNVSQGQYTNPLLSYLASQGYYLSPGANNSSNSGGNNGIYTPQKASGGGATSTGGIQTPNNSTLGYGAFIA